MTWNGIERRKEVRVKPLMFDHDYYVTRNRMLSRALAQDIITGLDFAGLWVKDMEFQFLEVSDKVAEILYSRKSNDCIGKSDFVIAKEAGLSMTEAQFAKVCRASDLYVKDHRRSHRFIELLEDTRGEKHIWRTIKCVKARGDQEYYFGFAVFLDEYYGGYDSALQVLKRDIDSLEKLSDNLYVYKD